MKGELVLQIPDYQEEVIFDSEECCSRKPASGDMSMIPELGRSLERKMTAHFTILE